jgi:hypothetical protein|nr:lysylphosphatidylglycerol synthase transmembrane domain-containing protein [Kofleriaceae bacterium]
MTRRALRWLAIAVVSGLAVECVRRLDPARALDVLATTDAWWVLAAMVVNATLRVGTRVLRTRSLLSVLPGAVPLRQLVEFVYGSMALGYVMSPIAASAARVFALQRHGVSTDAVVAIGLWEKVVTGASIAMLSGVMLAGDTPAEAHYSLLVATLLGLAGLAVAVAGATMFRVVTRDRAEPTTRVRRWLFSLGRSLARLTDARTLVRAFVWSTLSELCDVAMLALVMHALGVPVDPVACVLAFVVMNITTVLPSTPGQLGVFEATTAWALVAAHVPPDQALACGVLYHVVHVAPVFVIGLPSLLRIRGEQREDAIRRSRELPPQSP